MGKSPLGNEKGCDLDVTGEPILRVDMLGGCSLHYGERSIDDVKYRTRKPWLLLEYLITFRNREVPPEELSELLYAGEEGGAPPSGALKTLVYRVREMLEELGHPASRDMILVSRGSYAWNTAVPMVLDTDQFALACQRAAAPWLPPEEKLETCLAAAELYKGDFLARSAGERWAAPLADYYHAMFLNLARSAVELLEARERWQDVTALCTRAIAVDSYVEFFHHRLIRALVRQGNRREALRQYHRMYSVFYTELGAAPPAELSALYREVAGSGGERPGGGAEDIARFLLQEDGEDTGAFLCELEVFRHICRLEARAASREKRGMFLAVLSAAMRDGSPAPMKLLNNYMDKLGKCVQSALRRGDAAARCSDAQYVLLLPAASREGCAAALTRIIGRFQERCPRCPMILRYEALALEDLGEEDRAL